MSTADVHVRAAQRDAAFAKMYEAEERCDRLIKGNAAQWRMIIELCDLIAHHEALQLLDPEGQLVRKARTMLALMQLHPRGRTHLATYQARQGAPHG